MWNILSDIFKLLNSAFSYNFTRFEQLFSDGDNWPFQTLKKTDKYKKPS